MNTTIKTKAGKPAAEVRPTFKYTTQDVERYLKEKRIGLLKDKFATTELVLKTFDAGSKFKPFLVIMPTSVIFSKNNNTNNDEPSVFNQNTDSDMKGVKLVTPIYGALGPFIFNKADEQAFFSPDWRRKAGVPSSKSSELKYYRTPRITSTNKNNKKKSTDLVILLLDPLRIFHDMMTDMENPNENFRVNIVNTEEISQGEFLYTCERESCHEKKGKRNTSLDDVVTMEVISKLNKK